ncbi:MAG TPA: hypothetical protein VNI55_04660 [Gaiellaceae bacterium]|nr:hypothetical protein [Gaiellaceae bacterium]
MTLIWHHWLATSLDGVGLPLRREPQARTIRRSPAERICMSFMDKLKAMFSGGSAAEHGHSHDGHDHSHDGHDHSNADHAHDAMDDVPPMPAAPMDPLGTAAPEATMPPAGDDDRSA